MSLTMKIGHKGDMYFACNKEDEIVKIFYNQNKCMAYLYKNNN